MVRMKALSGEGEKNHDWRRIVVQCVRSLEVNGGRTTYHGQRRYELTTLEKQRDDQGFRSIRGCRWRFLPSVVTLGMTRWFRDYGMFQAPSLGQKHGARIGCVPRQSLRRTPGHAQRNNRMKEVRFRTQASTGRKRCEALFFRNAAIAPRIRPARLMNGLHAMIISWNLAPFEIGTPAK